MPVPLDEFPLHQVPLSMAYVGTSDRNFYDRYYFNAHDRSGDIFFISGMGFYPQLGVKDAFLTVRRGDKQWTVRCSDALDDDRLLPRVGGYRVEVIEPLQKVRLVSETDEHGLGVDLTWDGSFPALDEERHLMRHGARPILDTWRFAQVGTWSGVIRVDGEEVAVDSGTWLGTRDRSWGIRPIGEAEPPGRIAGELEPGFWWLYVPLRFEDFAVLVMAQEKTDGYRTLNDAVRIWPDGRVEQLGWPHVEISYRSGTRHPERARLHCTQLDGKPLVIEVETRGHIPLHVGCGYGADPEWAHGQWRGRGWVEGSVYDYTDPAIAGRVPWGVIDHVARATCDGAEGWGMFEHASIGRHDPSGFADLGSLAP